VTALFATENTRPAIAAALRARTCYATSGPRILLWFRLGPARMGAVIPPPNATDDPATAPPYLGLVIATAPITRMELIKNGATVATIEGAGAFQQSVEYHDPDRRAGDAVYLRVIQDDGHAAWSSPIFTR
jgi:hypothetical protein